MSSDIIYRKMVSEDVPVVFAIELASFPVPWTLDSFTMKCMKINMPIMCWQWMKAIIL